MHLMLQQNAPDDYVIATGHSVSLEDFVDAAFQAVGLNWRDHVSSIPSLLRPTDLSVSRLNPEKARSQLGWQAKIRMPEVVERMIDSWQTGIPF
jgi:GDPmannose 4,6-dehydratase